MVWGTWGGLDTILPDFLLLVHRWHKLHLFEALLHAIAPQYRDSDVMCCVAGCRVHCLIGGVVDIMGAAVHAERRYASVEMGRRVCAVLRCQGACATRACEGSDMLCPRLIPSCLTQTGIHASS